MFDSINIVQSYPSVVDLEIAAKRRIPRFAWEYVSGGIGNEICVARNRLALDEVKLSPQYLVGQADNPDISCTLLGQNYDLPFGIAPIGLSGLMWPKTSEILAAAAKHNNIPCALSTFATTSLEDIKIIGGDHALFQLYPPKDPAIRTDLLHRAHKSGYKTLIVTVDIPVETRRDRDIRNGLSVPPQLNIKTLCQILARPQWTLATLLAGLPEFKTLKRYIPQGASLKQAATFLSDQVSWHITPQLLAEIRDQWSGNLIIKGILTSEDAAICQHIGADAIVVSNHGGRQLDAACSALDVIGDIRNTVGKKMPLICDGGVRNGLDIARMLAMGADFVLIGRPFVYAVAALGNKGGNHVIEILRNELKCTLAQLGCSTIDELSLRRLVKARILS